MQGKNFQIRRNIPIKPRDNSKKSVEPRSKIAFEPNNALANRAEGGQPKNYQDPTISYQLKTSKKTRPNGEIPNLRVNLQSRPTAQNPNNQDNTNAEKMPRSAPMHINKRMNHHRQKSKIEINNKDKSTERRESPQSILKNGGGGAVNGSRIQTTENSPIKNGGAYEVGFKLDSAQRSRGQTPDEQENIIKLANQSQSANELPEEGAYSQRLEEENIEQTLAKLQAEKQKLLGERQGEQKYDEEYGYQGPEPGEEKDITQKIRDEAVLRNSSIHAGNPSYVRGAFTREHIPQSEIEKQKEQKRKMKEYLEEQMNEKKRKKEEEKRKQREYELQEKQRIEKELQELQAKHQQELQHDDKPKSRMEKTQSMSVIKPSTSSNMSAQLSPTMKEPRLQTAGIGQGSTQKPVSQQSSIQQSAVQAFENPKLSRDSSIAAVANAKNLDVSYELNEDNTIKAIDIKNKQSGETVKHLQLEAENLHLKQENMKKEELIGILLSALKQNEQLPGDSVSNESTSAPNSRVRNRLIQDIQSYREVGIDEQPQQQMQQQFYNQQQQQQQQQPPPNYQAEFENPFEIPSRAKAYLPSSIPVTRLNLAHQRSDDQSSIENGTPDFNLKNIKVSTPNRNTQMRYFMPQSQNNLDNNRPYGEPFHNPRVYSSPLTSTISKNPLMMTPQHPSQEFSEAPSLNGTYVRDRNFYALNGSGVHNLNQSRNFNNLKDFGALSGNTSNQKVHNGYGGSNFDPSFRGLQAPPQYSNNSVRNSQTIEPKFIKNDNLQRLNLQSNYVKVQNFNDTFNPQNLPTINNKMGGGFGGYSAQKPQQQQADIRSSLKFQGTGKQTILVVDEQNANGATNQMTFNNQGQPNFLRDSTNLQQLTKQSSLKSISSYPNMPRGGVNMIDSAQVQYGYQYQDGGSNANNSKQRIHVAQDPKGKFPKEVFGSGGKKKNL